MQKPLLILALILFCLFAIAQVIIGSLGIAFHLGNFWACVAVFFLLALRITLPFTIGVYFGAVDVLGWHWSVGLLLAVPGLLFAVPGFFVSLIDSIFKDPAASFLSCKNFTTKFFKRLKTERKEVSITIEALQKLRPLYQEGTYIAPATCVVFKSAEKAIRDQEIDVVIGITKDKRNPIEIALTTLFNVSSQIVSTGTHHIFRGVLSDEGKEYLFICHRTIEVLLVSGFINETEARNAQREIEMNIEMVG